VEEPSVSFFPNTLRLRLEREALIATTLSWRLFPRRDSRRDSSYSTGRRAIQTYLKRPGKDEQTWTDCSAISNYTAMEDNHWGNGMRVHGQPESHTMACIAGIIPARRAASIDPARALRSE
jgi:hypothetical protein